MKIKKQMEKAHHFMKIKKQMEQGSPFYENQEADGARLTVLCHRAAVLNLPEAVAGSRSTNEGRELVLTKHCEDISQGWPFNCLARVNKRPKIKLLYILHLPHHDHGQVDISYYNTWKL